VTCASGEDLRRREIAGAALLAGVGFTVTLLIGGLAYTDLSQIRESDDYGPDRERSRLGGRRRLPETCASARGREGG